MPLPETIDAGLADGTYTHAHEPIVSGGVDDYGEYCNVGYYVPWEYRRDFIRQAMGYSAPIGGGGWETQTPRECEIVGCSGMYPFGCRWSATGELFTNTSGDPIAYSHVQVVLQYRTPFFTWGGYEDPYFLHSITPDAQENELLLWATQEIDTRAETILLPNRELVWASGDDEGKPTGAQHSIDVDITDLSVTFQRVPFIPRSLGYFKNRLNARTFLGFYPGEVWFRGYRTQMKSWVGGIRTRSVQLSFSIREGIDWNKRLGKDLKWNMVGVETASSDYDHSSGAATYYTPKQYADMRPLLALRLLAQQVPAIPRE